jgi:hypothetical protein
MRRTGAIGILLLAAGSTPALAATPSAAPNLASCAKPKTPNADLQRKRPLPVPAGFRAFVKADQLHYAISTTGGGTICVDTSWMEDVGKMGGSADGRFLTFSWNDVEAYGYMFVDRAGRGQVLDTGVPPKPSPSGRLLAAFDQSESELGSLSGLAIWRVDPVGIHEVARVEDLPRMAEWKIDGWSGESCITLSALALEAHTGGDSDRHLFMARRSTKGWTVMPARRGGCPSA